MPRGIVGSSRGGVLTNQLRDNPCSVVLLDEIEKASPSLLNVFLQAFDEGWLTDGRGKRVYLSDAIVIMTSNAGSEHFRKLQSPLVFASGQTAVESVQADINKELERRFPPEFRNRIDQVVVFEPLAKDEVREIALKYLDEVTASLKRWNKQIHVEPEAVEKLVTDGYSPAYGARFLKRVIDDQIKLPLSQHWKDANHFRAELKDGRVVVETAGPRLVATAGDETIAVNF
jgi:ATP-dependent Clp protease ATP-binding subunit ClpA